MRNKSFDGLLVFYSYISAQVHNRPGRNADSKTSRPSIPQLPISPPTSGSNLWRKTNNPAGDGEQHESAFFSDSVEHDRAFGHSFAPMKVARPSVNSKASMIIVQTHA